MEKSLAAKAAKTFVETYFPMHQGAILAGSASLGMGTTTLDFDIVILDSNIQNAYRESLIEFNWPIEVFVHNQSTIKHFFYEDVRRARPSLPRMVATGTAIKGKTILKPIIEEAKELLRKGPEEWSNETIVLKRYFLTDLLSDLEGCANREEELFIVNTLFERLSEFVLRTNKR